MHATTLGHAAVHGNTLGHTSCCTGHRLVIHVTLYALEVVYVPRIALQAERSSTYQPVATNIRD